MTPLSNPLLNRVIVSLKGRHVVDQQGHGLIDFSTQCYLGFDRHPLILEAQRLSLSLYGSVVPWSRTVAVFDIFLELEHRLAALVGSETSNLFLSTTLLNHSVIPAIAGNAKTMIAFERSSHGSSFEGALLAQQKGAELVTWSTVEELAMLLRNTSHESALIITDGVNSMSGGYAPLSTLVPLALSHNALLYVDDAHGFGVVGENPTSSHPYGQLGNGLGRYFDCGPDALLYVGCFSKAYGLPGAFVACSKPMKEFLLVHATAHDLGFSGQGSVIKGILKALDLNEREGDEIRQRLYAMTCYVKTHLVSLGFSLYQNTTAFPILTVIIEGDQAFERACHTLYDQGILLTVEPSITLEGGGVGHLLRITLGNGLTQEDLEALIEAFSKVKEKMLQP